MGDVVVVLLGHLFVRHDPQGGHQSPGLGNDGAVGPGTVVAFADLGLPGRHLLGWDEVDVGGDEKNGFGRRLNQAAGDDVAEELGFAAAGGPVHGSDDGLHLSVEGATGAVG